MISFRLRSVDKRPSSLACRCRKIISTAASTRPRAREDLSRLTEACRDFSRINRRDFETFSPKCGVYGTTHTRHDHFSNFLQFRVGACNHHISICENEKAEPRDIQDSQHALSRVMRRGRGDFCGALLFRAISIVLRRSKSQRRITASVEVYTFNNFNEH